MSEDDALIWVGVILAGWLGLWLAWKALVATFTGAGVLLAYAAESGFVGLAAYIAMWFFLFPVMLIICLVLGFIARRAERLLAGGG